MIITSNILQRARNFTESYCNKAGITNANSIQGMKVFCESVFSNIDINKFHAIYPFMGGTAATNSLNLLSSTKYLINWNGSLTHNNNGVTGDGSTGYGNTTYNPSLYGNINSCHISIYCKTQTPTVGGRFMGALSTTGGSSRVGFIATSSTTLNVDGLNYNTVSALSMATASDYRKHFLVSRTASAVQNGYVNGSTSGGSDTNSTTIVCSQNIGLLARIVESSAPDSFTNANLAFVTIGLGLQAGEAAILYNAIQTLQVALGRNN